MAEAVFGKDGEVEGYKFPDKIATGTLLIKLLGADQQKDNETTKLAAALEGIFGTRDI